MRMSPTSLSIDRDLCRCCLVEGSFADLVQPYLHNGREEIYSDMIKDTFNIEIRPVPGQLCVLTYKICGNCIQKLREATLFKERVLESETKFKELYEKSLQNINFFKLHKVKVEEEDDDIDLHSTSEIKNKSPSLDGFGDAEEDCSKKLEDEIEELANQREPGSSPINDSNYALDMKLEDTDDESDISIADLRAKSKPKVPKQKRTTEAKTSQKEKHKDKEKKKVAKKRVKKENKDGEVAEGSGPKKKGKQQEDEQQNYTLTREADGAECYTCNTCQRRFKNKMCFKQHYNHVHLHLRPKLRGCYLCEEKVPGHMRAFHLEQMHGIPAPTCNACGKKFAFPFEVLRHQKVVHMGEKRFSCEICHMTFGRRNNLVQHVVKHSTVRSFKCDYCNEAFKWRKHLARHVRLHMKRQS